MKMNVTEKELWKLSKADSSSSVRHRKVRIALFVSAVVLIAALAAAQNNFPGENGGELTCWSLVYNQRELTAAFYDAEDWEHPYALYLGQKDWCKKGE